MPRETDTAGCMQGVCKSVQWRQWGHSETFRNRPNSTSLSVLLEPSFFLPLKLTLMVTVSLPKSTLGIHWQLDIFSHSYCLIKPPGQNLFFFFPPLISFSLWFPRGQLFQQSKHTLTSRYSDPLLKVTACILGQKRRNASSSLSL